jgi:ABC-2 type transport system permease protein
MTATVEILRHAAIAGFQDLRGMYSWKTWTTGWLLRVICQVIFYSLLGQLLGDEAQVHYLVVGNAVMLCATTVMFVVQSTTWERFAGTLPLLVAAPASPLVVLFGRSVQWIPDALATSLAALLVVGPLFGLPLPWPRVLLVPALLVLVTLSTYMMGAVFGSLVLRWTQARNLVANVVVAAMMAICGVNVPTTAFPGWVRATAEVLPLTHGLRAVRAVLAGGAGAGVARQAALEVAVGLGWFTIAAASFRWFAEGGRRDGSLEFGS